MKITDPLFERTGEHLALHVTPQAIREAYADEPVDLAWATDDDLREIGESLLDSLYDTYRESLAFLVEYARLDKGAIDVWLRIPDGEEEAEAEANTYPTATGYRVEWYLNSVGLVTEVKFATLADAYAWLEREGFANYTS